jgi:GAF domain-containing protein
LFPFASLQKDAMTTPDRVQAMLDTAEMEIAQAASVRELYEVTCQILVGVGGYCMAWIGLAEHNARRSVLVVARAGYESGYLNTADITWANDAGGLGPTGRALREGCVQVNNNTTRAPEMALWREGALARGYAASIAIPLTAAHGTFGTITAYARRVDAFGPREVNILRQLGALVSAAVIRLRRQAREALPHRP